VTLAEAMHAFGLQPVTGRSSRVAVIDSGVYAEHPHVQFVAGGVSLVAGAAPDDYVDRNGHGTAVVAAIREKAPAAELVVVKIFDRTLAATTGDLARAIEWASGQRVDLINLSLGTTNPAHSERLQSALTLAREAGAAVIAAADQAGLPSLPGSLRGAIAVAVDWDIGRDSVIVEAAGADAIRLRASGYPRPIPGVPPERNLKGTSFAVANATGLIARALMGDRETFEVERS
jgi:subtilisin family serine protease